MTQIKSGLYWWIRDTDETGMSGLGRVAQVSVFEDGYAVLRWLKGRNAAGVSSVCLYETAEQLVHVHGHGAKKTGHLEPVLHVGDLVAWHCFEGFGGVAEIVDARESPGSNYKVKIIPPHWTEHHYQNPTWAYDQELCKQLG